MNRHLILRLCACAFPVAVATAARADPAARDEAIRPYFAKGTWTSQVYSGYLNDLGPQDTEGGFLTAGVSYYVFDNLSLGAEFTGYGISQPGDDAGAVAGGIVMRHHLINHGASSYFIDVAFAPFEASERVPQGGTRFNFVTQTGIGLAQHVCGESNLLLGVRFIHISNAQIEGHDRNPSINGVSAYIGVMVRL